MTKKRKLTSTIVRHRREHLHAMQSGVCFWCCESVPIGCSTLDELVPRGRGGTQTWENIVMSCAFCNHDRDDDIAPRWARAFVVAREVLRLRFPSVKVASALNSTAGEDHGQRTQLQRSA